MYVVFTYKCFSFFFFRYSYLASGFKTTDLFWFWIADAEISDDDGLDTKYFNSLLDVDIFLLLVR